MKPTRLAAIDVGTNTIRSIVVEADDRAGFRVLDDERASVRLGEGVAHSRRISDGSWERAREALLRMGKIMDGFGVSIVEAVATSAVRSAANGADFVRAMERDTGIAIRVISGEEEAELAALSAWHHFDTGDSRYALADIGGGSMEVVTAVGNHIDQIRSLDLGAVLLTERFLRRDPPPRKDLVRLRKHVRRTLRRTLPLENFLPQRVIGSGGTMTAIGSMAMASRKERYDSVHGYEVLRSEIVHLLVMLERKSCKERRGVPGLSPERADIIVAGVAVVDELMEHLGANVLQINERGIREGLILRSLGRYGLLRGSGETRTWRNCIEDMARSCHADLAHAWHVRDLALKMFDGLSSFGMGARARDLLEAAAVLHDVGYFISYAQHHKHTYHLIRHADLFDFTPREKELIANVARYHRKACPKKKHEGFRQLGAADRDLVRRLGGLLRLADGLDRRRSGVVRGLRCQVTGSAFLLDLEGEADLSVELYGGQEKSDLFEEAFGKRVVLAVGSGAATSLSAGAAGAR